MDISNRETVLAIQAFTKRVASDSLTPSVAKLYSQFSRISAGQAPLGNWRPKDADSRLEEAVTLITVADLNIPGQDPVGCLRRAAEILEWLAPMVPKEVPAALIAGGAYQLAGYSARAAGLLGGQPTERTSLLLTEFFRGDFNALTDALVKFWSEDHTADLVDDEGSADSFHKLIVNTTASSLGVVAAWLRWGAESRVELALQNLDSITALLSLFSLPYSWLTSKISAKIAYSYLDKSLRRQLTSLMEQESASTGHPLENYARFAYLRGKALAWPSQVEGIKRLASDESFALCTPTGSGKTSVAEIAILSDLWNKRADPATDPLAIAPLVLYLVPSKALAAEVESRLQSVVRATGPSIITVTGLYGGIDWGPTDAWLTRNEPTVLVCTPEKAEALLRFVGPFFLNRLSLIILDEAHSVQLDRNNVRQVDTLINGENRSFRLESFMSRIFAFTDRDKLRVVALSAVIGGAKDRLDMWVRRHESANPVEVNYWSTRRLIGRLICESNGQFTIRYDLLDGKPLRFDRDTSDGPFVPAPFPARPPVRTPGPGYETNGRSYALWAGMNLAAVHDGEKPDSVLISVPKAIEQYAKAFLEVLDRDWSDVELPGYFAPPDGAMEASLLQQALHSCEDYFGRKSFEYRLLNHGIIMHHGGMPPRLSRLFVKLVEDKVIRLVLATSTLSEGVNLPFDVVLVPSLLRDQYPIPASEFANLAGRAGRPGHGTEGRCLVLMLDAGLIPHSAADQAAKARKRYLSIIDELQVGTKNNTTSLNSPLQTLLSKLWELYREKLGGESSGFWHWLETVEPPSVIPQDDAHLVCLDTLDGFLVAAISELEQLQVKPLEAVELEERLRGLWLSTLAHLSSEHEDVWGSILTVRGQALVNRVYTDPQVRNRLYRTSLPPRHGKQLLDVYTSLVEYLKKGIEYSNWSVAERLVYIQGIVTRVAVVSPFTPRNRGVRAKLVWEDVLGWWLNPASETRPEPEKVSLWFEYVSSNFQYRFNWGLGSVIALAMTESQGEANLPSNLRDWPQTGLPWAVFWIKELITWGTLEPVAAHILAEGHVLTRPEAEALAPLYYHSRLYAGTADEVLNAADIRDWATAYFHKDLPSPKRPPSTISANPVGDFINVRQGSWRVLPVDTGAGRLAWYDPAGYPVAESHVPTAWLRNWIREWDFHYDSTQRQVRAERYMSV